MALRIFLLRTINMTKLQETCNIHIHKMGYFPHCSPNCGVYPSASIKFEVKVCTYLSNACLHVTWWVGKNHSFRPTQDPMSYSGFVHFNDTFTFPSELCTYVPTLHTHCARPKSTESFLGHTCTPNAQNVVPHAFQRLCPWNEAWRKTIVFPIYDRVPHLEQPGAWVSLWLFCLSICDVQRRCCWSYSGRWRADGLGTKSAKPLFLPCCWGRGPLATSLGR